MEKKRVLIKNIEETLLLGKKLENNLFKLYFL